MDVQRYLDRIGYTGGTECTVENLTNILRCHLETVPFENTEMYKNPRELSLKPEDLYDKVVNRHMGGVCFELNGLFNWLLTQMGYQVYPVSVRISMFPGMPSPILHQGNVAVVDGKKYFCDVGFGGPGPKGLLAMDVEGEQIVDGEPFKVGRDGDYSVIFRQHEGEFTPILRYVDAPTELADYPILFYYVTTHPASRFVSNRTVNLCRPDGYLAVSDNEFSGKRGDEKFRIVLETEEEVKAILEKEFGLKV